MQTPHPSPSLRRRLPGLAALVATAACNPVPGHDPHAEQPADRLEQRRLPGEFEQVSELLLSWDPELDLYLLDVVVSAAGYAPIRALVGEHDSVDRVDQLLAEYELTHDEVITTAMPVDTLWVRDFGPIVVRGPDGAGAAIDVRYVGTDVDDDVAARAARDLWKMPVETSELQLEGGNLLSDGAGRCVTSTLALFQDDNRPIGEWELQALLHDLFGCEHVVILPMLDGEGTGHVDMYVTLPGPGRALVGYYDPRQDEGNAFVLDTAAQMLVDAGFHVDRIPMGWNGDDVFRSYTNAVALNEGVLVPIYPDHPDGEAEALAAFAAAYPDRDIIPVVSSEPILLGGAVHCSALAVMQ